MAVRPDPDRKAANTAAMASSATANTARMVSGAMSRSVSSAPALPGARRLAARLSRTPAIVGPISPASDQIAATAMTPAPMKRTWCDHRPVA